MLEVTFDSKETPFIPTKQSGGEFTKMLWFNWSVFMGRMCTGVCCI